MTGGDAAAEPYYRSNGDGRYTSTVHAQGAWNDHEQHMAPVSGILAHCLENFAPRDRMQMARLSFEILGVIPGGEFEVVTSMLRPGRSIELLQAELVAGGRTAVRATAWRLQAFDTSAVEAIEDAPLPGIDQSAGQVKLDWPGGYVRSIEAYPLPEHRAGRGRSWLRTRHPLIDHEPFSDLARLVGLVDTANGIAPRVPPGAGTYIFPNVDLQIHLYRQPTGELLGLENAVSFGRLGVGVTSSVLHDESGPFGRAEQTLTVRPI
ncbi:thioesterase family protein [Homoserinimonas sp. OAct 916]|uniref:thioesterase family protein n=1 Tax=Homoserinimonas sp. OAct 916 TaxID=2211450 RepID=UPI000DBE6BAB|nr:thioesterase family protein [Homoserinimonas sp. OAct 916]